MALLAATLPFLSILTSQSRVIANSFRSVIRNMDDFSIAKDVERLSLKTRKDLINVMTNLMVLEGVNEMERRRIQLSRKKYIDQDFSGLTSQLCYINN